MNYIELSELKSKNAYSVLNETGIVETLQSSGCRVNLVGSLKMGLLASHRDIDVHIYTEKVTTESSFAIMSKIAENRNVIEIKCINGLHTSEHCISWHIFYKSQSGDIWQIDVIHIESGSFYDGFFENMAKRICDVMTENQRNTILELKFTTPEGRDYHGVEYYEAVISDNVSTMQEFEQWVLKHRNKAPYYWIP